MEEIELESKRTAPTVDNSRIRELEAWFRTEYIKRNLDIQRDIYLGLKPRETRYGLELEAYNKENELRLLKGLEPLPKIKNTELL